MHVDVVRRIKTNFKIQYFNKKNTCVFSYYYILGSEYLSLLSSSGFTLEYAMVKQYHFETSNYNERVVAKQSRQQTGDSSASDISIFQ